MNTKKLAKMGRRGDTVVAHLTPGEVVIPREIADHPDMKRVISRAFQNAGLDLGRFTVGGSDDSRNPRSGLREFFQDQSFDSNDAASAGNPGGPSDSGGGSRPTISDTSFRDRLTPDIQPLEGMPFGDGTRYQGDNHSLLDEISPPYEKPTGKRAGFLKLLPGLGTLLTIGEIMAASGGKRTGIEDVDGGPDAGGDLTLRRAALQEETEPRKRTKAKSLTPSRSFATSGLGVRKSGSGRSSTILAGRGGTLG